MYKRTLADGLSVTEHYHGERLTIVFAVETGSDCILHWGLSRRPGGAWQRPPQTCWPGGTTPVDGQAARTPFTTGNKGIKEVAIHLDLPCPWQTLAFVVYFPKENRWLKSGCKDFAIRIPNGTDVPPTVEEALAGWAPETATNRQAFPLDSGERLATAVEATPEAVRVYLCCDAAAPLALHWGLAWQFRHEWQPPPEHFRPAGTCLVDARAARSPFEERSGLQYLELEFRKPADGRAPRGMRFVLYQPDAGAWLKSDGHDLYLPLFTIPADPRLSSPKLWGMAEQMVGAEREAPSWTLMHRFNLCHDLLERSEDDGEALALLFVWLRYSATRQLDWQRRYNTKPRELSHAQERLTTRLAGIWKRQPQSQPWVRLLLGTLGRGGDGQRVRDEILHIMHRHHIKEAGGHFIEEWHQKLHNNTTPDDIVICQAYLAFLQSHGDRDAFYRVLERGGVPRQRLKSFERPIQTDPEYYGGQREDLIHDFANFLQILKSVHAGTDLDAAAAAARGRLGGGLNQKLDALLSFRQRGAAGEDLVAGLVAARVDLKGVLAASGDDAARRDLLFLDLALEAALREAIERQDLSRFDRSALARLVHWTLQSLRLSIDANELALCAAHWTALISHSRDDPDWALHAKSVADRAGRWVQESTGDLLRRLQPKAEFLGTAFGVADWAMRLFSEDVIRGGPTFALALLLRPLDARLRQAAGLGGWQVISPGRASGRVRIVDRLIAVQGERFPETTVLVADAVGGNEEIPEGVTAVLTADTPDLVSHVAVRARNAQVLFATCWEPETYAQLKALSNRTLLLRVTPGGDVAWEENTAPHQGDTATPKGQCGAAFARPVSSCSAWVVTETQFTPEAVGSKASNLNGLRGRLADWIHLPASLAVPFGALEQTLADNQNPELRRACEALAAGAESNPAEMLARLRAKLQELKAPAELRSALLGAWQGAGLAPVSWNRAWQAIRRVWASTWNERAYLSRRAHGISHDRLRMAVLIQQVVEADYAFVIHTANPLTGNRGELYAEVVLGLGETLVGNYPGRALGFVYRKADGGLEVLSFPGKSIGMYGKGVIFRSDSNGEDLEGFAGAGLYDSFFAEQPERRLLDYMRERMVWDRGFRDDLLRSIACLGLEVERVLGAPQDIEGAVAGGRFYIVQTRPQVGLG
jgi:alpha-glucan,water dikinase